MEQESFFKQQVVPLGLTVVVFGFLVLVLFGEISFLNMFTNDTKDILLKLRWYDILIGLTIYLKTSIDFAIFIGRLMDTYGGWKNRVAIEIGTAFGNAAGTLAILIIWTFFKEVRWLLALMIFLAALVLFKLAEDSMEHAHTENKNYPSVYKWFVEKFTTLLKTINKAIAPVLKYVVPNMKFDETKKRNSFWTLFVFSFSIPFILGLDDFAGYVPLFSIVNVFGFAIGVFLGHMILNIFLYISPSRTIKIVKNPVVSLIGSVAFVALGIWGLIEVVKLIGH